MQVRITDTKEELHMFYTKIILPGLHERSRMALGILGLVFIITFYYTK